VRGDADTEGEARELDEHELNRDVTFAGLVQQTRLAAAGDAVKLAGWVLLLAWVELKSAWAKV
jgi:hypothetical protein